MTKLKNNSAFGFKKPQDSLGFLLWQTTITWQRLIKNALEPFGISHPQFVIMAILMWFEEHDYNATQISIVHWSKLDKMTVSQSLKKLAEQKLVQRTEHAEDTRAKMVTLTTTGRVLIVKLIPIIESIDANFFKKILKKDGQVLLKIFNNLAIDTHEK